MMRPPEEHSASPAGSGPPDRSEDRSGGVVAPESAPRGSLESWSMRDLPPVQRHPRTI
jgi:hypothetical protein